MTDLMSRLQSQRPAIKENKTNPDANRCWFCKQPQAIKETSTIIDLYRNLQVKPGLGKVHYKWEAFSRKLPCCEECLMAHKKIDSWDYKLMVSGYVTGMLLVPAVGMLLHYFIITSLLKYDYDNVNSNSLSSFLFVLWVGGGVSGLLLGWRLSRKIAAWRFPNTMPKNYAEKHPEIFPLIQQGWKLGNPKKD